MATTYRGATKNYYVHINISYENKQAIHVGMALEFTAGS